MYAKYLDEVIKLNGLNKIKQISTTSLIRIMPNRIQEGTFVIDLNNEILSYVDNVEKCTYCIDCVDINGFVGNGTLKLPTDKITPPETGGGDASNVDVQELKQRTTVLETAMKDTLHVK